MAGLVPLGEIFGLKPLPRKGYSRFRSRSSKSRNHQVFSVYSHVTEPVPNFHQPDQIKRVRLVRRADGVYV
jgi:hypothetical protein